MMDFKGKVIFIIVGPPGAGKGTQAELLSQKLNIPHISTGAILRKTFSKKTDDAEILKEKSLSESGKLVTPSFALGCLIKEMKELGGNFIIDGSPRTRIRRIQCGYG